MIKYLKVLLVLALLLFVTTFAVHNNVPVRMNYYFNIFNFDIPLYALIYASFIIGILIGMAVGISQRIAMWKKMKEFKKKAEVSTEPAEEVEENKVPVVQSEAPETSKKEDLTPDRT